LAAALPSNAHTYRLLIFKEPLACFADFFTTFSGVANRFVRQQQRNEIMWHLFTSVNTFLNHSLKRAALKSLLKTA
jgi:hypothetical protein